MAAPAAAAAAPSSSTAVPPAGGAAAAVLGVAGAPPLQLLALGARPRDLLELRRVSRAVGATATTLLRSTAFAVRHVAAFLANCLASDTYMRAVWRRVPAREREGPGQGLITRVVERLLREEPWPILPAGYWAGLAISIGLDARLLSLLLGQPVRTSSDFATSRLVRAVREHRAKIADMLKTVAELAGPKMPVDFPVQEARLDGACPVNYSAVVAMLDDVELFDSLREILGRKGLVLDVVSVAEFSARSSAATLLAHVVGEYKDKVEELADDLLAISIFRDDPTLLPIINEMTVNPRPQIHPNS
ncbi:hypothetical protein HK405_006396 [Cladochytrium tenue]|nr:hypothetical protein HK405_006396 [Cladochytrium tenue]